MTQKPREAASRMPARDFLGEVFGIELVHALDDRLHQLAGGGVVGVLGDRGDADAPTAQHRLERDGMLALASEAGEFPDQNLAEGGIVRAGLIEHPPELGPIGQPSALGFIDVFAGDQVAVASSEVAQRAQLGGDREVDILAVAGDAGVEGRGGQFYFLFHCLPRSGLCKSIAL